MAIYYSRTSNVRRSRGHSVVAAAAYRAGARLVDARTDTAHDYTKRSGVLGATMLAPTAAGWALDITRAWSEAEHVEVRRNACTGRELVVALPAELSDEENYALAQQLGQDLVDAYGVAVLVAVHAPDATGDARNRHVHLLMSTRVAEPDGFGLKVRVLDDRRTGPVEAQRIRERVAMRINAALRRTGHGVVVDPRRLAVQADAAARRGDLGGVVRLSRAPMKHVGRVAMAMHRAGLPVRSVARNTERAALNTGLHTWGTARAAQLRRPSVSTLNGARAAAKTRRAPGANRLGPTEGVSFATGADAELLNAQAHTARDTARALRADSEAYMAQLERDAKSLAEIFIAYFQRVGTEPPVPLQTYVEAAPAVRRRVTDAIDAAHGAYEAVEHTDTEHHATRRARARAEHVTAQAMEREYQASLHPPPAWRVLSRRQWADHRRRQRAEVERCNQEQTRAHRAVRESDRVAENAKQTWHTTHAVAMEVLMTLLGSRMRSSASQPAATPPFASLLPRLVTTEKKVLQPKRNRKRGL